MKGSRDMRVDREHETAGVVRGVPFVFHFDGQPIAAYPGETIAAALMAAGIVAVRTTRRYGRPRGLFCGIGLCFDCLVVVDGRPSQRACLTPVQPGMVVHRQIGTAEEYYAARD